MAEAASVRPVHHWPVRVYYEDTDAGGIVYHATYLRYAERARTELLRALGFDHPRLAREHGVQFTVRRCAIDFLRPAVLDDELLVETALARFGGASLDLVQTIRRERVVVARLELRLALVDRSGRARRAPRLLREVLGRLDGDGATAVGSADPAR